jgi:hypothetical protein
VLVRRRCNVVHSAYTTSPNLSPVTYLKTGNSDDCLGPFTASPSSVTWNSVANIEYYIQVTGWASYSVGSFTLQVYGTNYPLVAYPGT